MRLLAPLLDRTLVLVAHPDDEAAGCGALLQRMAEPLVVFATDGAPRDECFWKAHGSRLRYARVREEEARRALDSLGVTECEFLPARASGLDAFADQELIFHLPQAFRLVSETISRFRPRALLTLAYEGGHPDHDACSLLASVLAREHGLPAWEMPLYHRSPNGQMVFQRFLLPDDSEVVVEVTAEEEQKKQELFAIYASQREMLASFDATVERVRRLRAYDYSHPPHPGKLNYEAWGWRVSGPEVSAAFTQFLDARREQPS